MSLIAVLVDSRPDYIDAAGPAASLLLTPVGRATLLDYLRDKVDAVDAHALAVAPSFELTSDYAAAVGAVAPQAALLRPPDVAAFLQGQEPSDMLLIVDARYAAVRRDEFAALTRGGWNPGLVKHLVQLQESPAGAAERVVCDGGGEVQAIDRLYDGVTHLEAVGISASLVSVAVAKAVDAESLFVLPHLRTAASGEGAPSLDVTASDASLDLTRIGGMLTFCDRVLADDRRARKAGFTEVQPRVWAAAGCEIAPTSRLCGPVVIHRGAKIGEHAVIVGPSVVGAGARVGRRAVVCSSLLTPGADVPENASTVHRVLTSASSYAEWTPLDGAYQPITPVAHLGGAGSNSRRVAEMTRTRRRDRLYLAAKRIFDFQAAFLGLLVLAPLLIIAALLIRLTSRGPIFFAHEREGLHGRIFRCWKFRTMVHRAHHQQRALYSQNAVDGPQFKMENDPRVTRVGNWLRRTNIDELPQLFNVVLGQMTLIGPRPSPFRENQICVPWRRARLSVRPGITGLWQVCRHERDVGDFHQWIYFDTLYVRHMSFWLDLKILLATALTVGGRWSVPLDWMIPLRKRNTLEVIAAEESAAAIEAANSAPARAAGATVVS